MTIAYRPLLFLSFLSAFSLVPTLADIERANGGVSACPAPALSRIQRHVVGQGETLETVAQRYNLAPATIVSFNPSVNNGGLAIGTTLQIPPYNGIVVEVPRRQTWRQVAAKYKVRPDTLFEANGCQKDPRVVFVPITPGATPGSPNRLVTTTATATTTPTGKIAGYPLPNEAAVGLGYGWQTNPTTNEVFFHSGVDLVASVGTPVSAIAPGVVVFAKEQGTYGKVVIINHNGGYQSRYAQLDNIKVTLGQSVKKGDILGTVGTTGQPTSTQPHLHFEIRANEPLGWAAKDPKDYLTR
jgi:murein DD-endopeptidase MepM/ murein hydrolase activator NlpD